MNDTTRDEPMAGLAEWLEAESLDAKPRTREKLLRWKSEVESRRAACSSLPAPIPRGYAHAPKQLWLQLHGDCSDAELDEPVDYESDDVTWCWHEINASDVRYVRADLAGVSLPDGLALLTDAKAALEDYNPEWAKTVASAITTFLAAVSLPDGGAAEPALWQWRRKGTSWTLEYTFDSPVKATTDDSEIRLLYEGAAALAAPSAQPPVDEDAIYFAKTALTKSGYRFVAEDAVTVLGIAPFEYSGSYYEEYMRAANWLISRGLAKWEADGKYEYVAVLDAFPSAQPSGAPEMREPGILLTFSLAYMDGVMKGEPAEIRRHWQCVRDAATAPTPSGAPADTTKATPDDRDPHFGGHSYDASLLRELLAVIHGDGGHYVAELGIEKAALDAAEKYIALAADAADRAALAGAPAVQEGGGA